MLQTTGIKGPDEASAFLDVHLKVVRDWFSGVGRLAAFRIPSFRQRYFDLFDKLVEDQEAEVADGDVELSEIIDATDFEAQFVKEANKVARELSQIALAVHSGWCDTRYGNAQLHHILEGIPTRFDKAVVAALTLNRRCSALGYGEAFTIQEHEIVASVFYFANLRGHLQRASTVSNRPIAEILAAIARVTDQSEGLIDLLAGKEGEVKTNAQAESAATHIASYDTQHKIARALLEWLPDLASKDLRQLIVRRRNGAPNLKALPDEAIERSCKVTTGPYLWPRLSSDTDHPAPLVVAGEAN